MPDWLPWAGLILLAVAAGWAFDHLRNRPRPPARTRKAGGGPATRSRPTAPPRPRAGDRSRRGTPRPGEIWWAEVPYADGSGAKVRPCLVLGVERSRAEVLKITSRDKSDRDDHLPIPTRDWDPRAERDSFLDIGEPIGVALTAFTERAGTCDPDLWARVRELPHLHRPTPA